VSFFIAMFAQKLKGIVDLQGFIGKWLNMKFEESSKGK
jgi:hypothetical protein